MSTSLAALPLLVPGEVHLLGSRTLPHGGWTVEGWCYQREILSKGTLTVQHWFLLVCRERRGESRYWRLDAEARSDLQAKIREPWPMGLTGWRKVSENGSFSETTYPVYLIRQERESYHKRKKRR